MSVAAEASTRVATGADQRFWDALAGGRLEMQRCARCASWHWPAVWRCAECGCWEQAWVETPMRGEIYAWTRNWHPFGGLEAIGTPFVTVVVSLAGAGGRRLAGLLEGGEGGLTTGAGVEGRIAATPVGGDLIPSIHWRLGGPR
jgi:uncharacterized OB-fold protein